MISRIVYMNGVINKDIQVKPYNILLLHKLQINISNVTLNMQ